MSSMCSDCDNFSCENEKKIRRCLGCTELEYNPSENLHCNFIKKKTKGGRKMANWFPKCDLNCDEFYFVFDEVKRRYVRCKYDDIGNCFVSVDTKDEISLRSEFMLESDFNKENITVYKIERN